MVLTLHFVIKTFASKFIFVCTMYMVFNMDYFRNSRGFFLLKEVYFSLHSFAGKMRSSYMYIPTFDI